MHLKGEKCDYNEDETLSLTIKEPRMVLTRNPLCSEVFVFSSDKRGCFIFNLAKQGSEFS